MPINRRRMSVSLGVCLTFGAAALLAAGPKAEEGVKLFESGRYGPARAALEAAAKEDPKDARVALYLGRVLLNANDLDNAVAWLEKAVAIDPKSSENEIWLGRAYGTQALKANFLKQASLAGKVRKAFEKSVELDPGNIDGRLSLIDYYLQAPGIMGGSVEKAREQAAEIARRDPMRGHRAAGRIAEYEKHFDAALAAYERAAKEFPGKREPFFWIAGCHSRQKQYGRALEAMEKLLGEQPGEPSALFQIGVFAAASGERLERGEECLKLYLQHTPKSDEPSLVSAHYRLGLLYEKKGNRDLARREYAAALELDPSRHDVRDALKKLAS
jgi:tetratricopeptide (TPR) repeat protein